jgi:hypothetical protein
MSGYGEQEEEASHHFEHILREVPICQDEQAIGCMDPTSTMAARGLST